MYKNITVTGGSGFVGSNLIKLIKGNGYNISVLTRGPSREKDGIKYINVNYQNLNSLVKATEGSDVIIHLAATLFARNKNTYIRENVNSTKHLVEAANINGIKRFIHVSSLAAGGPSPDERNPRDENTPDNPVSYYGKSKLLSEKELFKLENKNYVILRPPIIYGPNDASTSTIAQWVKKGIIISPSNVNSKFSFVYVNDLCKAIKYLTENDLFKGEIFYIAENNIYTWHEFIEMMAEKLAVKTPKFIKLPYSLMKTTALIYEFISWIFNSTPVLNRDKIREANAYHWICSSKKWEEKTGFKWTLLKEGLEKSFSQI